MFLNAQDGAQLYLSFYVCTISLVDAREATKYKVRYLVYHSSLLGKDREEKTK